VIVPEAPDLSEQDDLRPFLQRVRHVHPSDLADVLSALDESVRVRVISELPIDVAPIPPTPSHPRRYP
jgi:Mg/Co/Ni transporter MgtE